MCAQTNTFPSTGDVGIGTISPSVKLDVVGNIRADCVIKIDGHGSVASLQIMDNTNTSSIDVLLRGDGGSSYINDGKVGIGTKNPDSKLTVNGNIHAEEVRVDLSVPRPDYVFKKENKLKKREVINTALAKRISRLEQSHIKK